MLLWLEDNGDSIYIWAGQYTVMITGSHIPEDGDKDLYFIRKTALRTMQNLILTSLVLSF